MAQPLLAKKKSAASLHRQILKANSIISTEIIEDKSLAYRNPAYEDELKIKGSHLIKSPEGIINDSKLLYQKLLITVQAVPENSLFCNDLFKKTCNKLQNRNEVRVVENISPLIIPSAETLAIYDVTELNHLIFNVNKR